MGCLFGAGWADARAEDVSGRQVPTFFYDRLVVSSTAFGAQRKGGGELMGCAKRASPPIAPAPASADAATSRRCESRAGASPRRLAMGRASRYRRTPDRKGAPRARWNCPRTALAATGPP